MLCRVFDTASTYFFLLLIDDSHKCYSCYEGVAFVFVAPKAGLATILKRVR